MANTKLRQLFILIGLYVALPSALICAMLAGWMVSVENATLVLQSTDSPDGRYRAEIVREDPGVSSGYEYMVRLMPAGLPPLTKSLRVLPFGPVFTALDVHREPEKLTVQWTGAQQLTIHCDGCRDASQAKEQWRDITVKYDLK
jgi:hypothetical protein